MIVTCPSCAARYRLKDSKVTGRGAKITCPSCSHVFVVYPEQEEPSSAGAVVGGSAANLGAGSSAVVQRPMGTPAAPRGPELPPAAEAPRGRRNAENLDFRKVGINAWKVKVKIGLTYDFADIKTLRKFIQDGRVTGEDKISHDGRTWVTIGDIPDLDAYFIDIYEKAEAELDANRSSGGGFEDDDAPTMIVGMSTLSSDLAADALRQATSSQDGMASDPPSPLTPSGSGQFVDPFAALKSKQRERIQQRRSATAAPPKSPEKEGSSRGPVIAAVLLLAALGAGWWFTQGGGATPQPQPQPQPQPTVQPADNGGQQPEQPAASGAADDLRRMVEETLQEGAEGGAPIEEDPVLIPVGPRGDDRGQRNPPSGGTGGATTNPGVATETDHAANCLQFARNRDWSQASYACANALKTQPNDATLLTNHGIALYETGNRDAASGKLRSAERMGAAVAKKYLGHIARDNGDIAGAIGHYRAYLATNPSDGGAIQAEIDRLTGS